MNDLKTTIPAELRGLDQWVCWRYEERDGKLTKVPYRAIDGRRARSTSPEDWSPFDAAWQAAATDDRYDGIGFVFSDSDGFAGIDLDQCIDEAGDTAPEAQRIIDELASYTEVSPSGRGVKIFIRGSLEGLGRNRTGDVDGFGGVEIYDRGRYFTVTGNRLPGTPMDVRPAQAELEELHASLFGEPPLAQAEHRPQVADPDARLLARARAARNGAKFIALFDDGDTSGYGSHSEADMALVGLLAFWADGDESQIDRLFRLSALYREKWDRKDYRDRTIRSAVNRRSNQGERVSASHPGGQGGGDVRADVTDLANATELVRRHADELRYCPDLGHWFGWDGSRWLSDPGDTSAMRFARDYLATQEHRSAHALRTATNAVKYAQVFEEVSISGQEFDAACWLFNCESGTISLKDGALREHRPSDHLTKMSPVSYSPGALCPTWERFLDEIFDNDTELITYVKRVLGMALTGDISEQYLWVFHGVGANGKSTLLDTVTHVMGDYAGCAPPGLLVMRKHDEHPTEIADLRGLRMAVASETEEGQKLRLQLVKQLTGDAKLKGRYMRQDYFEFDRTHKLILVTNNVPSVGEQTEAAWRRIRLVPFECVIPTERRDPHLGEKLRVEASGILRWLVDGCLEWQRHGLNEPPAVLRATDQFRHECDAATRFIEECCEVLPGVTVSASNLGAERQAWVDQTGAELTQTALANALASRGCTPDKSQGKRIWRGVRLIR